MCGAKMGAGGHGVSSNWALLGSSSGESATHLAAHPGILRGWFWEGTVPVGLEEGARAREGNEERERGKTEGRRGREGPNGADLNGEKQFPMTADASPRSLLRATQAPPTPDAVVRP